MTATASGAEALYPFLNPTATDLDAVLSEVARSTAEKAVEIVALRERLAIEHERRLIDCASRLAAAFAAGGRLYAFGNGGSSTDAQDVVQLFLHPPRPARPLPAASLTCDVAVLTALSNDVGYDVVFARQLAAFGKPGDIAFGLSTSGGSANALRAFDEAARRGMTTVGLAGYDGGAMAASGLVEHLFVVPSASVHRVQEAQTTIYHVLWELIQRAFGDSGRDLDASGRP